MKKIFICSPLRGNLRTNMYMAEEYSKTVAMFGDLPITPHIYFTRFLDDSNEKERELGITMGIELLKLCDEINVYGEPSEGMKKEIEMANRLGIKTNFK
jgi:hypothetical protein